MNRCFASIWGSVILIVSFIVTGTVHAHEPIFGIGPHTIYQYGIGLEAEFEGGKDEREVHFKAIFGVTEDLAVTGSLSYPVKEETGLSNLFLRGKWRFYRKDSRSGSNQAALAFGIRTPGLKQGPDALGYLFAATIGREARREYFFSGLRYMLNTTDEKRFNPGDVFKYDVAAGIRPIPAGYEAPDLVLLLELNGTYTRKPTFPISAARAASSSAGHPESGNRVGVGPGLIFTYRNIMLKAGLNFIVTEASKRIPFGEETEFVFALESHLSPFSFIYGR